MARLLVYYVHPGHRFSHANAAMYKRAGTVSDVTLIDLYAKYPRFDINIDAEQAQLLAHDVILFQFPLFWYSTPPLLKQWMDLVLEHGFAYGSDGNALNGKAMMTAITCAGPEEAYTSDGYQHFPLRTFLTPLEQTASLCGMEFITPYVLYGALKAQTSGRIETHAEGYRQLIEALRDDTYDRVAASAQDVTFYDTLPIRKVA